MRYDVAIAGGGLAGSLLLWRLKQVKPHLKVMLVEQGSKIGGDQTWGFHENDISAKQRDWLRPLVSSEWSGYEVRFPKSNRKLNSKYSAILSMDFDIKMRERHADSILLNTEIDKLEPLKIHLKNGKIIGAACVIDALELPEKKMNGLIYRKFLGLDVRLSQPHGLEQPVLIDGTCDQKNGWHFFSM